MNTNQKETERGREEERKAEGGERSGEKDKEGGNERSEEEINRDRGGCEIKRGNVSEQDECLDERRKRRYEEDAERGK